MKKVALDEILDLQRYEQGRDEIRQRIIALKKQRRVAVGEQITFVFENHDTMWFQIQEMLRAERIVDSDRVRDEMAVYNALVPDGGELSTTMLIEFTEQSRIREELVRLIGIDQHVWMQIGTTRIRGEFEGGRSSENKLSAVQYVRFKLDAAARAAFLGGTESVTLIIDHPNYRYRASIEGPVRAALAADLDPV